MLAAACRLQGCCSRVAAARPPCCGCGGAASQWTRGGSWSLPARPAAGAGLRGGAGGRTNQGAGGRWWCKPCAAPRIEAGGAPPLTGCCGVLHGGRRAALLQALPTELGGEGGHAAWSRCCCLHTLCGCSTRRCNTMACPLAALSSKPMLRRSTHACSPPSTRPFQGLQVRDRGALLCWALAERDQELGDPAEQPKPAAPPHPLTSQGLPNSDAANCGPLSPAHAFPVHCWHCARADSAGATCAGRSVAGMRRRNDRCPRASRYPFAAATTAAAAAEVSLPGFLRRCTPALVEVMA